MSELRGSVRPRQVTSATLTTLRDGATVEVPDLGTRLLLNASALAIWDLCDGKTTLTEIAEAISVVTGTDLEQALSEVEQAVTAFYSSGAVSYQPDEDGATGTFTDTGENGAYS